LLSQIGFAIIGIASAFECEIASPGDRGVVESAVPNARISVRFGLLGVAGILVGGYLALGSGFYWLMQPRAFANAGIAAYKPPPGTVVVYPEVPFVAPAPAPSVSASAPAVEPPVEAAFAAAIPEIEAKPAIADPKQTPKKRENVATRANDRLAQRSAERHGSSWASSSSPASPDYR
jgi:hypothetical protein